MEQTNTIPDQVNSNPQIEEPPKNKRPVLVAFLIIFLVLLGLFTAKRIRNFRQDNSRLPTLPTLTQPPNTPQPTQNLTLRIRRLLRYLHHKSRWFGREMSNLQ